MHQSEVASACWKINSDTLVTVMILFEKESISMVIASDNNHHDKRRVVPYLFTVFNNVKEMFRGNIQNINIWTDMAHLLNLKISFVFSYISHNIPPLFLHYDHATWNHSAASHGKEDLNVLEAT